MTGLPGDVVGKPVSEVVPNLETFWLKTYERVVKTGNAERFEQSISGLDNNWFNVYASRVGGDGSRMVVLVYYNITERKRHEANLAFLAEVSQDLVRLTNIDETMNALGAKIGGYFDLSACAFAELSETAEIAVINYSWHLSDVPSLVGTYRMQDFVTPEILQLCLLLSSENRASSSHSHIQYVTTVLSQRNMRHLQTLRLQAKLSTNTTLY